MFRLDLCQLPPRGVIRGHRCGLLTALFPSAGFPGPWLSHIIRLLFPCLFEHDPHLFDLCIFSRKPDKTLFITRNARTERSAELPENDGNVRPIREIRVPLLRKPCACLPARSREWLIEFVRSHTCLICQANHGRCQWSPERCTRFFSMGSVLFIIPVRGVWLRRFFHSPF